MPETSMGSDSQKLPIAPRPFHNTGFELIDRSIKIEEETLEWYKPESYYPVNIGEVLCSRYQVLYKVGFGSTSTVWMCRDLRHGNFVCLKAMVHDYPAASRELAAYLRLQQYAQQNPADAGPGFVSQIMNHFTLSRDGHEFHFFVFYPLGLSLQASLRMCNGKYPLNFVRQLAYFCLRALDFNHRANVVHTDITVGNIHFTVGDEKILKELEQQELQNPSPRKLDGNRTIFKTRHPLGIPYTDILGPDSMPLLCDFGDARSGKACYTELAQPDTYRSPEIHLGISWHTAVDIWNLGCILWYCATGEYLFPYPDEDDEDHAHGIQIATMVALLGPPPPELLATAGEAGLKIFKKDGTCKYESVSDQTLESRFRSAFEDSPVPPTDKESAAFISFIRRGLRWKGEDRPSASDLLVDPWISQKPVNSH